MYFRGSKRSDESRILSPTGQRRNVPVSVFSTAKQDHKRSAPVISPSSSSPTNDSNSTNNGESFHDEQESQQQQQRSFSSRSTDDSNCNTSSNGNEINNKLSTTNTSLKSSTGNILDELSLSHERHDTNKKMNVFERLFRGHKKKV